MANKTVRKVSTGPDVISGLNTSRYEKAEVAFGVIEAGSYTLGDTLVFDGVRSFIVIEAKITVHTPTPVTLEVLPGTDLSSALSITAASAAKVSYVINYIRGAGAVAGNTVGDLLQVTIAA